MTLNEAIKQAEERADLCEYEASKYDMSDSYEKYVAGQEGRCAKEQRQLAEWLKELKQLREQIRWTPVSEPPKENGVYMISLEDSIYPWGRFFNGKWFMLGTAREFGEYEVRAWQPLPKPYNGDTRGEE